VQSTYIDHENDTYRVAATRVSLDSLIYAYLNGHTAEAIAQAFPLLTLEQVYGALASYLAHRETITPIRGRYPKSSSALAKLPRIRTPGGSARSKRLAVRRPEPRIRP
jgi:hypothetical protein